MNNRFFSGNEINIPRLWERSHKYIICPVLGMSICNFLELPHLDTSRKYKEQSHPERVWMVFESIIHVSEGS